MNERHTLGNITQTGLGDIWRGERARSLRRAMEADDLTLGCGFCSPHLSGGRPGLAYARWFDGFDVDSAEPAWPVQLELSISNTCNLRCVMCNGEWSSSIRSQVEGRPPLPTVYDDAFFEELRPFLPHLERVKFLGGEPFLAGETLRVMEMLVELGLATRCHVTTNGTHWSPRIERILSMLPVDVSVSLDAATAKTYESIRRGASWDGVRRNLDRYCEWAERRGTYVSVTFCLMTANWQEFGDFCRLADELGVACAVNSVVQPAALSLDHLGQADFDAVVTDLARQDDRERGSFTLSIGTWSDEVGKLRRQLADRVAARALRDRYARDGTPRLELDGRGYVRRVVPNGPVLGIAAAALVGRHHRDLQAVVATALGAVAGVDVRPAVGGIELSVVRFAAGRDLHVLAVPAEADQGGSPGTWLYFAWVDTEQPHAPVG